MEEINYEVTITLSTRPGALKAFAVIKFNLPNGALKLFGFLVMEPDGKKPWVAFPQKQGVTPGKYFPVTEAEGILRDEIAKAVLHKYAEALAKQ